MSKTEVKQTTTVASRSEQLKRYTADVKGCRATSPHDNRPVFLVWCDDDFGPFKQNELLELRENLAAYNESTDQFVGGWWLVRCANRVSETVALPSSKDGWPLGTSSVVKGVRAPRF